MIYNTGNRSKAKTESQKEKKICFNAHFQFLLPQITGKTKIWSLKSLAMLKYESGISLYAVQ